MMKIVVRSSRTERASTQIVLPVSGEMTCSACHQSGRADDAKPSMGGRGHSDEAKDITLDILRLHDENQQGNLDFFQALENQGFSTNGLYQTVVVDGTATPATAVPPVLPPAAGAAQWAPLLTTTAVFRFIAELSLRRSAVYAVKADCNGASGSIV